jgi:hypothetical protein
VRIDTRRLEGSVDFVGGFNATASADPNAELAARPISEKLTPNPNLPADTELWAALQSVSGGSWGGCVYDVPRIKALLNRPSCP